MAFRNPPGEDPDREALGFVSSVERMVSRWSGVRMQPARQRTPPTTEEPKTNRHRPTTPNAFVLNARNASTPNTSAQPAPAPDREQGHARAVRRLASITSHLTDTVRQLVLSFISVEYLGRIFVCYCRYRSLHPHPTFPRASNTNITVPGRVWPPWMTHTRA